MKTKRQEKIIELITGNQIETQEMLVAGLLQAGFDVTQATVSRDIRELKLVKVHDGKGRSYYRTAQGGRSNSTGNDERNTINSGLNGEQGNTILRDSIVSMEGAGNILVIRTIPGMAMAAAATIDALDIPQIVGSIAGDDTIMCAIKTPEIVEDVIKNIHLAVGI